MAQDKLWTGKRIRINFGDKWWFIPHFKIVEYAVCSNFENIKMINKTEEACSLENWIHDISVNLEQIEQQFLLQDPYDSVWLKIMAILFYFIGLFSSATMLAFINYESGHHGNFRSVINQLLSNLYAMVSSLVYPKVWFKKLTLNAVVYHYCIECQFFESDIIRHFKNMYHFILISIVKKYMSNYQYLICRVIWQFLYTKATKAFFLRCLILHAIKETYEFLGRFLCYCNLRTNSFKSMLWFLTSLSLQHYWFS